jgi:hypothetical protein
VVEGVVFFSKARTAVYQDVPASCPWTVEQLLDEDYYG